MALGKFCYLAGLKAKTMSKFKVGDRVRCIEGYDFDDPKTGWCGTVRSEDGSGIIVTWDGMGIRGRYEDACSAHRLELIEPATDLTARIEAIEKRLDAMCPKPERPEYKFGDRVDVLTSNGWYCGIVISNGQRLSGKWRVAFVDNHGADWAEYFTRSHIRPA